MMINDDTRVMMMVMIILMTMSINGALNHNTMDWLGGGFIFGLRPMSSLPRGIVGVRNGILFML